MDCVLDGSNNHKEIIEPNIKDRCKVQKSMCINSNMISLSNDHLPVMGNEHSPNNLGINKPTIWVRKDLGVLYCGNSSNESSIVLNKPIENTMLSINNSRVSLNKNLDTPGCSKTITDRENNLNALSSVKQEPIVDDSLQSRVSISLKDDQKLKQMNKSINCSLNIPNASANSLELNSPITVEGNLNALNCEPSTSSNNATEWKSFWNKKKVQSRDKRKNNKQESTKSISDLMKNKERYQTRAITRKENANELVRKRKQDVEEDIKESNKKMCDRNKILEPLVSVIISIQNKWLFRDHFQKKILLCFSYTKHYVFEFVLISWPFYN